jgi:hypothetical protein
LPAKLLQEESFLFAGKGTLPSGTRQVHFVPCAVKKKWFFNWLLA